MAKIFVIAGGEWQCPLVKKIKNMGHEVICSNLFSDSPAFKYADEGYVADVLDKETNLKIAQRCMPDAIVTDQSDIAVPTVAFVAEKLGLKGIGTKTAELFTNKFLMREFCKKNSLPTPQYRFCRTYEEALELLKQLGKIIIKPIDSQSSRGVYIITKESDLEEKFIDTVKYSNSEKAVLAEEYIEGPEFTVDGIKTKNSYWVTGISKKSHFGYNSAIAKELLFSNYNEEYDYNKLRKENTNLVIKMGLPFGLTHAEYKYMNGQYYLIEIAARGGGTKISSDIVPYISGIDTYKMYINTLLGNDEEFTIDYSNKRCAVLGFFDFKPGKIMEINGIKEAKILDGVLDIKLNFQPGDIIQRAEDDRSRLGHFILVANSQKELRDLENKVKKLVRIKYVR